MGKKYDKGYDDGWYDGYMQGIEAGKKTVFIPQYDSGTKPFTCVICGGMLSDNFVCNNPSCPTDIATTSVNKSIYETTDTVLTWADIEEERKKYWESRLDDMVNTTPLPSVANLDWDKYEAEKVEDKDKDKDVGC